MIHRVAIQQQRSKVAMVIKRSDAAEEAQATRALAREVGTRSVGQLEAGLARMQGESGPTQRWMLAALVLLNGGGIAVTASAAPQMAAPTVAPAMIFFVFGASIAVVAALTSIVAALMMPRQIGEASSLWAQVATTGVMNDAALKAAIGVRRKSLLWSVAGIALALLSLFLFMTGALTLADGIAPPATAVSAAEAALADMEQQPGLASSNLSNAANAVTVPAVN
jgi:hypothetical protein